MTLVYDFDILDMMPEGDVSDPQFDGFLKEIGFKPNRDAASVALFRDPQTAEALRNASPALRDYFLASGFGLNTYRSGAPTGRYPAKDEAARMAIICRLTKNAERFALPPPEDMTNDRDQFCLDDFLAELAQSEPLDEGADRTLTHAFLHDQRGANGDIMLSRTPIMPPMFDTKAAPNETEHVGKLAMWYKFRQHRHFKLVLAVWLMAGIAQLANGPAFQMIASL
ncbi:MAG: hypothetical protein ACK4MS_06390 [Paracoccaceae bacterium]